MDTVERLPVVVIGAGPVAAVWQWGHVRLFSPWRYNVDTAARRAGEPSWVRV